MFHTLINRKWVGFKLYFKAFTLLANQIITYVMSMVKIWNNDIFAISGSTEMIR